jgi:hypothetical protein
MIDSIDALHGGAKKALAMSRRRTEDGILEFDEKYNLVASQVRKPCHEIRTLAA